VLPSAKKVTVRKQQIEHTRQWMLRLGEAQKDFILAARRDLGFAKKLRTRGWQLWRRRTVEEWPGGRPGKTVTLAIKNRMTTSG
jgi:hypothetical protein